MSSIEKEIETLGRRIKTFIHSNIRADEGLLLGIYVFLIAELINELPFPAQRKRVLDRTILTLNSHVHK